MSANTVCNVKTVQFDSPAGMVGVVLITVDGGEPATGNGVVKSVADKFKLERLSGPSRIDALLITMTGELTAESFARRWRALAVEDSALGLIMSKMRRAEVVHAKAGRGVSDTASLHPQAISDLLEPGALVALEPQVSVRSDASKASLTALLRGSVPA